MFVSNDEVYMTGSDNRVIKKLRNGQLVTIAGTGKDGHDGDGQPATEASFSYPSCVIVSPSNQVYISDGSRIRKIDRNGIITTIAGNGTEEKPRFFSHLAIHTKVVGPCGMFVTDDEEVLFCDFGHHLVRKIDRNGTNNCRDWSFRI